MISQTCLTAPTGVPVAAITHWAGPPPLVGAASVLPAGHVLGLPDGRTGLDAHQ